MSIPGEQTGPGAIYVVIGTDQHGNPVHEEVQETPLSRALAVALAPERCPAAGSWPNFHRSPRTAQGETERVNGCSYCDGEWPESQCPGGKLPEHAPIWTEAEAARGGEG